LAENGRLSSVSHAGCTGRMRALRGMYLGVRVGEAGAREGRTAGARGTVVMASNRTCRKAGKKGKRVGDAPYRNAELLGHLCDGRKRWSGGRPTCGGEGGGAT
jgi:hypothetical protein